MTPIDFGGGMIFPSSYGRDQFTAQQEARQEAGQAADEARMDEAHEEALQAADKLLRDWSRYGGSHPTTREIIDAYLEALNAH